MMLTTKARYSVSVVIFMCKNSHQLPMSVEKISENQKIESRYLEQILRKLKIAGIVSSLKGPGGGYKLVKKPEEITIADIVQGVGESLKMTRCGIDKPGCMRTHDVRCSSHELWAGLTRQISSYLSSIRISDIFEKSTEA